MPINYNRLLIVRFVYEDAKHAVEKLRFLARGELVDRVDSETYNEVLKKLDAAQEAIKEAAKIIHCAIVESEER